MMATIQAKLVLLSYMYILFSVIKHKKVTIIVQIKCPEENICYVFSLDLTEFQVSKSLGLAEEQMF